MYVQWCVKGISSGIAPNSGNVFDWDAAKNVLRLDEGIVSNWWRKKGTISPGEVADELTQQNLDRHLHDYGGFGPDTPFISLASGCVERDKGAATNFVYSAIDTALDFATDAWNYPGALFYCWVSVALNPAVEIQGVAEAVRDLNVYHRWSRYQLEGEIAAKVHIPANQISKVEWWDGSHSKNNPQHTFTNHSFVDPSVVTNVREFF